MPITCMRYLKVQRMLSVPYSNYIHTFVSSKPNLIYGMLVEYTTEHSLNLLKFVSYWIKSILIKNYKL